ncbi:hydroxyacid dehydrogenase [Falsiroseomonas bella]|uniref:Hydroxyacid dehydrogenase n=1 Tax=Falsiroseomonas bella TaxID=2184016 RepID=A0A317FCQ3_9PROT|nr:D-2-hydroxyacid dehydrogenase family protein [Falsiroseomonas bella]PWS36635.1 hydroxyacid dehydrogenase [Falsiroseomonas bella]
MPELKRLAILDDYQGVALSMGPWDRLPNSLAIEVFRDTLKDREALVQRLLPFDAILGMRERTPFPASLIERLPNLKLLITTGERNRGFDVAAAKARGIVVSGTPGAGAPTVDITWALILNLLRNVPAEMESLRAGRWQTTVGTSAGGLTLGVVGLGKLGTAVAKVGAALGMKVIAWSQNLTPEKAAAAGVEYATKEELFARADVITLHVILSDRSRGLVGAADIARMKPGAILVNTSRGPLIDQPALIAALNEKKIRAGIDVFEEEPLPPDAPILACPNTMLTPHLGYVSTQAYAAYFEGAVAAVEAYLAGKPIMELPA